MHMDAITSLFTQILAVFQQVLGPLFDLIAKLLGGIPPS
jgi:hypothetical protein